MIGKLTEWWQRARLWFNAGHIPPQHCDHPREAWVPWHDEGGGYVTCRRCGRLL